MSTSFEKMLEQYDYKLPEKLIAQEPSVPRDAARLLVYDRKKGRVAYDIFRNIKKYLPKNSVLVFNQTKVIPARLHVKKETGGKAEIFYISRDKNFIKAIADRKLSVGSRLYLPGVIPNESRALPRREPRNPLSVSEYQNLRDPFARLSTRNQNADSVGMTGARGLFFTIIKQEENFYFLKPSFKISEMENMLSVYGKTPLPPYIKYSKLKESERRKKYQTVFAKTGVSVAAPTASLHFTKSVIAGLKREGIEAVFVNLNVGLGTFASLKEENIKNNSLHSEWYEIPKETARVLRQAKKNGRPVVAVGTTVVRTLESSDNLKKLKGDTSLFIREGYKFEIVDALVTNFHVPKSSLLMLVSALTGREKLLELYSLAIKKKFKFFSFGDGMLIK